MRKNVQDVEVGKTVKPNHPNPRVACVLNATRYMWMRATQASGGTHQLREGPSSTYLPGVHAARLDAAYGIPGKGVAYIFAGTV